MQTVLVAGHSALARSRARYCAAIGVLPIQLIRIRISNQQDPKMGISLMSDGSSCDE